MRYKSIHSLNHQSNEPAAIILEGLSINSYATLHAPDDYVTSKLIFNVLRSFMLWAFYF